jgi:hypothetical protein
VSLARLATTPLAKSCAISGAGGIGHPGRHANDQVDAFGLDRKTEVKSWRAMMPFDGEVRPYVVSGGQAAAQSAVVLDRVEFFFDGGAKWARRALETIDGKRCLLGAIQHVRHELGNGDDRAAEYLAHAIDQWQRLKGLPPLGEGRDCSIMGFNDAHRRGFADIAAVLREARQLAMADTLVAAEETDQAASAGMSQLASG